MTLLSSPTLINGFPAYAPELAHQNDGFNPEAFEELYKNEEGHFWFQVRNQLIIHTLKKYASFSSFLEIGCGTGYVLKGLSEVFPTAKFSGSEIYVEGLKYAQNRLPNTSLCQMDARNIPFENELDTIGIFDALEHIKEDDIVLKQIHKALKDKGFLILTVPQHQWLWSDTDVKACHVLRYTKKHLHQRIQEAGFKIIRSTSFVTTLLPLMLLNRLAKNEKAEFALSKPMNSLLKFMMTIDYALIKLGINLPIGGSRLVLAQKI